MSNWGGSVLAEDVVFANNSTDYRPGGYTEFQNNPTPRLFIGGGAGGAVANWGGSSTLRRAVLTGNGAQAGGAIYVQDTYPASRVLVEDSSISSNSAFMGAGLFSVAMGTLLSTADHGVVLNRVTMSNNTAELAGGGIYNIGTLRVSNSTLAGNRAWDAAGAPNYPGKGGGIYNSGRALDIESSTIAGNEAQERRITATLSDLSQGGDEIYYDFTNNRDNVNSAAFRLTVKNSIIGDGIIVGVDDNCNGPTGYKSYITSLGSNTDSGTTCFTATAAPLVSRSLSSSDPVAPTDPGLAPLADNGGPLLPDGTVLQSRALASGSPALGRGRGCPGSDQRNLGRLGSCDIGAYQNAVGDVPGNAAPEARADLISATVGGNPLTIRTLDNDSDPDAADRITLLSVEQPSIGSAVKFSSNGNTDTQNGVTEESRGGAITYTPPPSYDGALPAEVAFNYTISDGVATSTGQVTVVLYAEGVNTPPTGVADQYVTSSKSSVVISPQALLANDSDADKGDGGSLTVTNITKVSGSQGGDLVISNSPTAVFTPNGDFSGTYQFTYDVVDPRGGKTSGIPVTITVDRTPVVAKSKITLEVSAGQTIQQAMSVSDPEGQPLAYLGQGGEQGELIVNESTGVFSYAAMSDATGSDAFSIAASDGVSAGFTNVEVNILPAKSPVEPAPDSGAVTPPPSTDGDSSSSTSAAAATSGGTGSGGGGGGFSPLLLLLTLLYGVRGRARL